PAALVEATVRAALTPAAATASGSVIRLAEGVLRSMFLFKLRTVAATLIAVAALAAGAHSLQQEAPAPRPQPDLHQTRPGLAAPPAGAEARREPPPETGPPPQDLKWTDLAPAETLPTIEQLAAQSKGNYEKIKTWRGAYAYVSRQRLDERFVAQFLAGQP